MSFFTFTRPKGVLKFAVLNKQLQKYKILEHYTSIIKIIKKTPLTTKNEFFSIIIRLIDRQLLAVEFESEYYIKVKLDFWIQFNLKLIHIEIPCLCGIIVI